MWNTILEILERKAAEGLDVRILYDDVGCFWLLPKDYTKALEKKGIRAYVFNPFKPILTSIQNNRDHRKIASIDGKVAFTGGINLADEYINEHKRLGVWKDASVMLEGDGAWNLTIMFLQMWELISNENEDFRKFYPQKSSIETDGLVLPYGDRPMDDENVGEQVYMQMITNAKKYLYINTPYLIIDDSMVDALTLAAKSGVDVRLVTPHIGDNRFIHATTRSYYYELVKSGVKVYEYGDGFIHSKTFLSDDLVATVGTTNLDFRSLYLHFECGVWFYKSSVVKDLYADYMKTLERCIPITLDDCKKIKPLQTFFRRILRLFAPLM